ncbi:MAG TPA: hypothetical protein VGK01_14935 [Candidatus Angelobacter sp.]
MLKASHSNDAHNPAAPGVQFQAEFSTTAHSLRMKLFLHNQGGTDIYVFNHLWSRASGSLSADSQNVYQFFRNGTLRLLYGPAPLPRLKTVTYRNIPFVTLLQHGATLEWNAELSFPIKEYNVYYPEDPNTAYTFEKADHVEVIIEFVKAGPGVVVAAVSNQQDALRIISPGVLDLAETRSFKADVPQITVLKRADEFSRLILQGEEAEPIKIPMK